MRGRSRRRARRAVAIAMGAIAAAGCMPGDLPTPPPVAPGLPSARSETPASAPAAGRAAAPAGRSGSPTADADGIVVDLSQMPDLPCHAMFDTIMGDCSAADIARIRAEILARRSEGGAPPTADSGEDGFLPWDGTLAMAEAQLAAPMTAVTLTGRTPFVLDARPVRWAIGGTTVAGYGYNGMIPGPLLKVRQGATLRVDFSNRIDLPTTVHWHGLRHANASDGVPGVTQPPVPPGERWAYELTFPDAGMFWYHPHVREDIQQDAGLAGVIVVEPHDGSELPPVDREAVLVLDDIRLENGRLVPYGLTHANFAIMGRFGNTLLVNGRKDYRLAVDRGDVVRFYIVNSASARPFRLSFDGATVFRVAGDLGRYVRPARVGEVVIGPAERYILDARFDEARAYRLRHTTPEIAYDLGSIDVREPGAGGEPPAGAAEPPRADAGTQLDFDRLRGAFDQPVVMDLEITADIPGLVRAEDTAGGASPADTSPAAARSDDGAGGDAGTPADDEHAADEAHAHAPTDGLEWEDDMAAVNRRSDTEDVRWILRDRRTGAENHAIHYAFDVGDLVRVRLHNLADSPHPMHHPVHIHGQRFLVTAVNGEPNPDLVWKDTVLVPRGTTADLLLEITNPGTWMVHCHIPEHMESGMMFLFDVAGGSTQGSTPPASPPATPHGMP